MSSPSMKTLHLCNDLACCFSVQSASLKLMHGSVQLSLLLGQLHSVVRCSARTLQTLSLHFNNDEFGIV